MKKLLCVLTLLLSTLLPAQQRFVSFSNVENPPYGLVAQLWNASSDTIYVDSVSVAAAPNLPLARGTNATLPVSFLSFGFGLSNLEENQCTSNGSFLMGGNTAVVAFNTVRVTQQPCTPNGRPYGQSNGNGTYNYTPTNFVTLDACIGNHCWLDFSGGAIAIQPGTGITIYTSVYDGVNGFGWTGYAYSSFRWHNHVGCTVGSNNPLCLQ
jgi:hypothetical protein